MAEYIKKQHLMDFLDGCIEEEKGNRSQVIVEAIKMTVERMPMVEIPPHGRLIDADTPIPLVDTHGKKIEVTVAHIIENNSGIVNAIIEAEDD